MTTFEEIEVNEEYLAKLEAKEKAFSDMGEVNPILPKYCESNVIIA
jgi:hypothetical protein